jgi:hypothetical protein
MSAPISGSDRLTLFLTRAQELESFRFYCKRCDWSVDLIAPGRSTFPDEQDHRAFLTALRPFLLKRDPMFLEDLWEALLESTDDSEEKSFLSKIRAACSNRRSAFFVFESGRIRRGPTEVFDLFINAGIFHNDVEKINELAALPLSVQQVFTSSVLQFEDLLLREVAILKLAIEKRRTALQATTNNRD